MDFKDLFSAISKLKDTVEAKFNVVTFQSFKTKDGSELICESFEAGKTVKLKTETGDVVAPDGQHELEDGRVMVIQNGVLIEAREKTEMKADEQQFDGSMIAAVNEMIEGIRQRVMAMAEMIVAYEEGMKKQDAAMIEQAKFNKEIMSLVEKMADAPSDGAAQEPKGKVEKPFSPSEFRKAFRADLKKFMLTNNTDN